SNPRFELACVILGAKVSVANIASIVQTTDFVFQKDIVPTFHRIAAINGRGAILQDVDVINHWEVNEIDVHARDAGRSTCANPAAATNYRSALSIDQSQSFFGQ